MTAEQKILMGAIAGSGKFQILDKKLPHLQEILILTGFDVEGDRYLLFDNNIECEVKNCTLLARPVSDMTRGEFIAMPLYWNDVSYDDNRTSLMLADKEDLEYINDVLYCLSIGVLTQRLADSLPCKVEWLPTTKQEE